MSTLDARKNFVVVQVSTGYNSTATSIVLSAGEGAKLPDPATAGAFNMVWWNSTDYLNPADDPYKEIVRCTARSTDTLTVSRAQEGTSAQNHNLDGKDYKMMMGLTAKMIDDIETAIDGKAASSHNHNASDINAGTLPIARGGTGATSFTNSQLIQAKSDGSVLESSGKTAPTGDIVGTSDAQDITNKRNQKRVYSTTSASSLTPEIDTYDIFEFTALAANLTINNYSSSTPVNGEMMMFIIKDNGTARTISWGNKFANGCATLPTTTTASKRSWILVQYNSTDSKFYCISVGTQS